LPVKFICGFIYSKEETYAGVRKKLQKKFGKIDFESEAIDFTFTDYYYKEMGKPLFRKFISFEKLKDPGIFVDIKLFCIKIEKKYSKNGEREINIDPGYLNEAKIVLTTTKDFHHRIYLGKAIYAEVTLYYSNGNFQDLPTTYPDYRTQQYKDIFLSIREKYHKQVKNGYRE
jgi:hypothetical protein